MGLMRTYMKQRMTVFHPTGRDDWDAPIGTTAENVACRISYGNKLIRTAAGDQVVSRAQIETEHPVTVGDLLTLPDGTKDQVVLDVRPQSGLGGQEDHREVYL